MKGCVIRELLQDTEEGSAAFEEYLQLLNESQRNDPSKSMLEVSSVCEVRIEGCDCLVIADTRGYFRYVNLAVTSFRVYAVLQEGVAPWMDLGRLATISETQKTYIKTTSFHPTDLTLYFSLACSPYLCSSAFIDEPLGMEHSVSIVGKHNRSISAIQAGTVYTVSGDEGGGVRIWNTGSHESVAVLDTLHKGTVTALALVASEMRVVTGSVDSAVNILESSTGVVVRQLMVETGRVTCIAPFTTSITTEECFSLGNDRGAVMVCEATTGKLIHLLPSMTSSPEEAVSTISTHTSSTLTTGKLSKLFSIGTSSGVITVFSRDSFRVLYTYTTPAPIAYTQIVQLPAVDTLAAVSLNGSVWMWSASKIIAEIEIIDRLGAEEEEEEDEGEDAASSQQSESIPQPELLPATHTRGVPVVSVSAPEPVSVSVGVTSLSEMTDVSIEEVVEKEQEPERKQKKPKNSARLLSNHPMGMRNPEQIINALRPKHDIPQDEPQPVLGVPRGDRARKLQQRAEDMEKTGFDAEKFAREHPAEYEYVKEALPVKDITSYKQGEARYGALPSLLEPTDDADRPGFLTKSVDKQLDAKWVTSLNYKPSIDALTPSLRPYLVGTSRHGEIYDCPAPSRAPPHAPLHFPSIDSLVAPFV
eukprot:TRINITY_DN24226_c0_g1_i1.p1 TRINITY_DN24226_c0_g1~~TRINITY_DN24226_c0_g1_i1.p1  ORF type:complete len:660 (+),score=150.74 TRINITY_DN24226_c0_g1_i1:47-1981(+)